MWSGNRDFDRDRGPARNLVGVAACVDLVVVVAVAVAV